MSNPPKVLICMPTYGVVKTHTVGGLMSLTKFTITNGIASLKYYFENKCTVIPKARNRMAALGREKGFDYVLFVDADMQFPEDALARLISHDRDICGVLYNKRLPRFEPVGQLADPDLPLGSGGVVEASFLGCGLLLIRTSVFDKIKRPWFYYDEDEHGEAKGEDYNFIRDCKAAGITAWADLDLSFEVAHVGEFAIGWKRSDVGAVPIVTVL